MASSKTRSGFGNHSASVAPPSRRAEDRKTRRPRAATPALGTRVPNAASAEWTARAKRLIVLLEGALNSGGDPERIARVERAYAAWELGNTSSAIVSRVAHLVDRAYVAMHEGNGPQREEALQGCAHILYNGLPAPVRKTTDFPRIVELVRGLQQERELWTAVVRTTADLLGWNTVALTHAGQAIRVAMAAEAP